MHHLDGACGARYIAPMGNDSKDRKETERAERLAEALRENLRRRKGQARKRADTSDKPKQPASPQRKA